MRSKTGGGVLTLYRGYNWVHQKDYFLINLTRSIPKTTIGKDVVRHRH